MRHFFAHKITLAYFILGFLWIFFSDHFLVMVTNDVELLTHLQNYKGWFYIATTALLLFFLIRSELRYKNKLLAELNQAKLKAEESDRLKTAFLSNMSHEIRTPLNGILGFSNLMCEENVPPKDKQLFLVQINMNGQLLLKIINDIIEVSKIQENMLTINFQQTDINQLLNKLVKTYQLKESLFQKKGLELRVLNQLSGVPLYIETDPARLLQILVNLMDNALKYTDEGWISIGYSLANDKIHISIEDTGIGITNENQTIIFERFKQNATYKDTRDGFGLGLSISKGIVEALNGQIHVESVPDKGSRFTVIFPIASNNLQ